MTEFYGILNVKVGFRSDGLFFVTCDVILGGRESDYYRHIF